MSRRGGSFFAEVIRGTFVKQAYHFLTRYIQRISNLKWTLRTKVRLGRWVVPKVKNLSTEYQEMLVVKKQANGIGGLLYRRKESYPRKKIPDERRSVSCCRWQTSGAIERSWYRWSCPSLYSQRHPNLTVSILIDAIAIRIAIFSNSPTQLRRR